MSNSLRAHIERYRATVPLLFAHAEESDPSRLFGRRRPGAPCYGGPGRARPNAVKASAVATAGVARVRARQRELGVPEAFEWPAEVAPGLRARTEAAGLPLAERPLTADAPASPKALALPRLAFAASQGTAVEEMPEDDSQ